MFDPTVNSDDFQDKTKILINGNWVAFIQKSKGPRTVNILKIGRRKN